jgi:hypothetical protein
MLPPPEFPDELFPPLPPEPPPPLLEPETLKEVVAVSCLALGVSTLCNKDKLTVCPATVLSTVTSNEICVVPPFTLGSQVTVLLAKEAPLDKSASFMVNPVGILREVV